MTASEEYTVFKLNWEGRLINVSYQFNWLNSGYLHVELRCDQPLPVTQTGYRSIFIASDVLKDADAFRDYVHTWLADWMRPSHPPVTLLDPT